MTLTVKVDHAAQIRAGLRAAPARMKVELRKSNRTVAKKAQGWARSGAAGGTPQQRRAQNAIKGTGSSSEARLSIGPTAKAPFARGAFWGAKKWPQFLPWVGASWKPFEHGQGPYRINDALADHEGDVQADFLDGQLDALARAFPK